MIPLWAMSLKPRRRIPRESGDDPPIRLVPAPDGGYSPQERG